MIKEKIATSPVAKKRMDFYTALKETSIGRKIRRIEWPSEEFGFIKDGLLMVFRNGVNHTWIISDGDMGATDWITL